MGSRLTTTARGFIDMTGGGDQAQPELSPAELWGKVAGRVTDYLRALGVQDPLHLERLMQRIRQRFEARASLAKLEDPVEAGVEEAYALLDEWLCTELGIEGDRDTLFRARAAVLGGAVPNWVARFAEVSGESLAAPIRAVSVQSIPEYAPLSMEPNTIELFWHRLGRIVATVLRRLISYLPADSAAADAQTGKPQ